MSKYIVYCRKSSESEERQVLSVESQLKELKDLTDRLNLNVFETLTESKSAKYPGRPIFNGMMKSIYEDEVKGIITWKLDRLARNPIDGAALVWLLDQGKIAEILTPHQTFRNTSNDKFLMQLEFGMAKKYVDDLSDNVKRGNRTKLDKGWLPGLPPLGYLNEPRERTIVPDADRFPIVRKMWELLLQGVCPSQILRTANEEWGLRTRAFNKTGGKPLSFSSLYEIFGNPFYYGLIERKEGVFQGKHKPMITVDEYWKAQEILGRKGRARPKKHQFAFTGLIQCKECGCMITAEEQIKRSGNHYTYYHCTKKRRRLNCGQRYISLTDLEKQILEYLSRIYVPESLLEIALEHLKDEAKEEQGKDTIIHQSVERAYADCRKKIENLNQMRLRDLLDDKEYISEKKRLLAEKIRLEEALSNEGKSERASFALTEKALIFANKARERFLNGSPEDKRALLQGLGSNFFLENKNLQIEIEKPLLLIEKGVNDVNGVSGQINTLELTKTSLFERGNGFAFSKIPLWWAAVEDVRTYYRNNPTSSRIPDLREKG